MKRVNFLIIGVQKAATTWLCKQLSLHSEIYLPPDELHYFNNKSNFEKGISWYESRVLNHSKKTIFGEKTPDYIWTNDCDIESFRFTTPKRIMAYNRDMKLILILRNPIDRFVSAFHHNQRRARISYKVDINDFLNDKSYESLRIRMLLRGLYYIQISRYLEIFPRSQMKIVFHDDIRADSISVLEECYQFLNVKTEDLGHNVHTRANEYSASKLLNTLLYKKPKLQKEILFKLDKHIFKYFLSDKIEYPVLKACTKDDLHDYYRDDICCLQSKLGIRVPGSWLNCN